ncbi:MAG: sulfatase [Alphaproteobacteria bacterium]|nr:sulfatase [Alphaproteobacteria bacterium]MCB9795317.1 sulfatase [Alphaproteobacteria bacterium]
MLLLLLACSGPAETPPPEPPPAPCAPAPVLHLVDLPGRVSGEAPPLEPLTRWTPDTSTWSVDGLSLAGVAVLEVRLREAPADDAQLRVLPTMVGGQGGEAEAMYREVRMNVEGQTLRADLRSVLSSSRRGEAVTGLLQGLRLELSAGTLAEVQLLGDAALYPEAASVAGGDVGGVRRPSWALHPGASVELEIEIPAEGALVWSGAGAGARVLRVGEATLHRDAQAEWTHQRVPLDAYAGQRVRLTLANEGPGLALFGDPRVVTPRRGCEPDVLVYLIDTLRADHVGGALTPFMNLLAAGGLVAADAWSSSSWTKPATVSLFTGLLAPVHRVGGGGYTEQLRPDIPTLQARLRAAGWRTGSFVANPLGGGLSGLDQGFGAATHPFHWKDDIGPLGKVSAAQLREASLAWLDEEPDQPFFAYVHSVEPHEWGQPPYPGDTPAARYALSVQDADLHFGRMMAELKRRDRLDNTWVVLLSDHGESLGEHGLLGHGSALFEEQVRIPLLLDGPGLPPGRLEAPAHIVDVAPTLLDALGLAPLPEADGRPLPAPGAPGREAVTASILRYLAPSDVPPQHAMKRADGAKVIAWEDGQALAFDLEADPQELDAIDASALQPALMQQIEAQSARGTALGAVEGLGTSSGGDLQMLRELGYVE